MDASERGRNGSGDGFRGGGRGLYLGCTEELSGFREEGRRMDGRDLPPHGECEDERDGGDDERALDCAL